MSNSGGYSSNELLNGADHPPTPAGAAAASAERNGHSHGHGGIKQGAQAWAQSAGANISHAARTTGNYISHASAETSKSIQSCFGGRSGRANRTDYEALATDENGAPIDKWTDRHPLLTRTLVTVLSLFLLLGAIVAAMLLHLVFGTLHAPSAEVQKAMLDSSLLLKGPESISVLNISDAGVNIAITGHLGLDPDRALDLWLGEKKSMGAWKRWDRSWIEWVLNDLHAVQVDVGEIRIAEPDWSIDIPEQKLDLISDGKKKKKQNETSEPAFALDADAPALPAADLLSFRIDPLYIPIPRLLNGKESEEELKQPPVLGGNHSSPRARKTLREVRLELLFKPAAPAEEIIAFVNRSVNSVQKSITLDLKVASLALKGLNAADWQKQSGGGGEPDKKSKVKRSIVSAAKFVSLKEGQIRKRFTQKVPESTNGTDTSHLLDLTGYDFFEIKDDDDLAESKSAAPTTASEAVAAIIRDGLHTMGSRALGIKAHAVAQNPLGKLLNAKIGLSLPFGVFLPVKPESKSFSLSASKGDDKGKNGTATVDSVLMAVVAADPFAITGKDEFKLELTGRVVPPPEDALPSSAEEVVAERSQDQLIFSSGPGAVRTQKSEPVHTMDNPAQVALSDFLSKFLRGDANTVIVHGGNPFLDPKLGLPAPPADLPGGGSELPAWLDNVMRQLQLPISFPGSKVTDLIKNVSISDLKIHPHPFEHEKLLADGTVTGVVDLPGQLASVDVMITDLWPDIIVYNGKPPSMRHGKGDDDEDEDSSLFGKRDDGEPEPAPPLPDPLPKHAFGRVRPHDFTNASTYVDPADPAGQRKLLKCELKNVPFEVLPGRGQDFRSFSWKILTGEGVLAGIEGSARAKIWNSGLGKLELRNLPVSGAFVVGKRGGGGDDDGGDDGGDDSGDDRW